MIFEVCLVGLVDFWGLIWLKGILFELIVPVVKSPNSL